MFKLVLNLSLVIGAVRTLAARSHERLDEIQGRSVDFRWAKLRDPDTSLHIDGMKRQASSVQLSPAFPGRPHYDCYEHDGEKYRGTKTTTRSGRTCQSWGSQSPHSHSHTPILYPFSDLTSNYCRNPGGDHPRPWCYTTDSGIKWEYCGIPKCTGEAAYLTATPPKEIRNLRESVFFYCEAHPGKESRYDEVNYPTGLRWTGPDGATIGRSTYNKPLRVYTQMNNKVQIALFINNIETSDAGNYTCLGTAGRRTVKKSVSLLIHTIDQLGSLSFPSPSQAGAGDFGQMQRYNSSGKMFCANPERAIKAFRKGWMGWLGCPKNKNQLVYYRFNKAITVVRFGFRNRPTHPVYYPVGATRNDPIDVQFVGSNDCASWTTIKSIQDIAWTSHNERKFWDLDEWTRKKFTCYGIRVLKSAGGNQAVLQDIKMWEACYEGDGSNYRGRENTTKSGRICQNWPSQSPYTRSKRLNSDLTSNYCRNPDGEHNGPWCYTTDGWEYCGIPKCSFSGLGQIQATTTSPTTAITTTTPTIASEKKPVAKAFIPTSFFIYKTEGKTWREARQACQEKGGDLASLVTNKEIESIRPFVPEDNTVTTIGGRPTYTGGYWIGGIKKTVVDSHPAKKHWLWLTGEPIPNLNVNSYGTDCAAYYKIKELSKASIDDDKCDEKRPGYICQFRSNLLQIINE